VAKLPYIINLEQSSIAYFYSSRDIIYKHYFYIDNSTKIIDKVNVLFSLVKICASKKKIPYNQ